MSRSFQIRKATEGDAREILSCLAATFEDYRNQYTPAGFSDTVLDTAAIQVRLREMWLFAAVSEGKIVGTIGCAAHGSGGHIRGMAVLPEWQGTGVAAALLEEVERALREAGCTQVTLDTTEPLTRAIRFYEKHGFRATGRVSDFFGMRLYEYAKRLVIC